MASHVEREPARLAYGREGEPTATGPRHEPQVVSRELARTQRGLDRLAANIGKENMEVMGRTKEDEEMWPRLFDAEQLRRLHKIIRGEN